MEKKWGPRTKLREVESAKDLKRSSSTIRRKVRKVWGAGSRKNQEQTVVSAAVSTSQFEPPHPTTWGTLLPSQHL